MLLENVREDPYPTRDQLDLIERSLPPEMVADYARVLMEKGLFALNLGQRDSDATRRRCAGELR
jgi:hypothetical protein